MPEPLEIRRRWYRLRLDDEGVHINRKPAISWDRVGAFAVGPSLRSIAIQALVLRGGMFTRPCLHVCVRGEDYPRAARAVAFRFQLFGRGGAGVRRVETDAQRLAASVAPWRDRIPDIVGTDDISAWWWSQKAAHPPLPAPPPPPPTTHQRATEIGNELHDLQDQLRRIEARKKHGHPPA